MGRWPKTGLLKEVRSGLTLEAIASTSNNSQQNSHDDYWYRNYGNKRRSRTFANVSSVKSVTIYTWQEWTGC